MIADRFDRVILAIEIYDMKISKRRLKLWTKETLEEANISLQEFYLSVGMPKIIMTILQRNAVYLDMLVSENFIEAFRKMQRVGDKKCQIMEDWLDNLPE